MSGELRSELLKWINSTFYLSYSKVEQCGDGAVYCQIMDSIYQDIPMSRVNFDARAEYDRLGNMKILQAAFQRHGITRIIDVDRLVKCRLQDNLEILQWLKKYWLEKKDVNVEYDPEGRRNGKPGVRVASGSAVNGSRIGSRTPSARVGLNGTRAPSATGTRTVSATSTRSTSASGSRIASAASGRVANGTGTRAANAGSRISSTGGTRVGSAPRSVPGTGLNTPQIETKISQLTNQIQELQAHSELLEAEINQVKEDRDELLLERNFFYNKLIDLEDLVKLIQESMTENKTTIQFGGRIISNRFDDVLNEVLDILYAKQEGFDVSPKQEYHDDEMSVEDKFNLEDETF